MGANSGEPWSRCRDFANETAHGRTAVETGRFLCRHGDENRDSARPAWIGRAPRIWLKVVR